MNRYSPKVRRRDTLGSRLATGRVSHQKLGAILLFACVLVWPCVNSAAGIHGSRRATMIVGAVDAGVDNKSGAPPVDIPTIHKQPFFWTVMVASLVGWVLGMVKGFDGAKDWLAKYSSKPPKWALFFIDLIIFVVFGTYIGTGLYQPATFTAALGAGLSWPVALGALVSKPGSTPQ